jgi:hypothetical protein
MSKRRGKLRLSDDGHVSRKLCPPPKRPKWPSTGGRSFFDAGLGWLIFTIILSYIEK